MADQNTTILETLPLELVLSILSLLDVPDLLKCRLLSSKFDSEIRHDIYLQYTIELYKTGCVDGSPDYDFSTHERLRRLKDWEKAWRNLDLKPRITVRCDSSSKVVLWTFRSGIFVVACLNDHDGAGIDEDLLRAANHFNTLEVYFTRCTDKENNYAQYNLGQLYTDLVVDAAEDLIVLSNSSHDTDLGPWISFDLITVSDGSPHNRASAKSHRLAIEPSFDSDALQIHGDFLVIKSQHAWQATPEGIVNGVVFLNWTNGTIQTVIPHLLGSCMLNGHYWLSSSELRPTHTNSNVTPSIDVWAMPDSDKASQEEPASVIAQFKLPQILAGVVRSVECRAFNTSKNTVTPQSPRSPPLPFVVSPLPSMVWLKMHLTPPNHPHVFYDVFVYTIPFLSAIRAYESRARTSTYRIQDIPWEDWGPQSSFWFRGSRFQWPYPSLLEDATYGYRVLLPDCLLDFTPGLDHNGQSVDSRAPKSVLRRGSIELLWKSAFDATIQTTVSFRRTDLADTGLRSTYNYFLMDEEVLAVKESHDDRTANSLVFTVLRIDSH